MPLLLCSYYKHFNAENEMKIYWYQIYWRCVTTLLEKNFLMVIGVRGCEADAILL